MKNGWLVAAGFAVAALWLVWAFQVPLIRATPFFWRPETLGQWGDTFGALNALFAAAAFIGVLRTLSLQRQQLEDQRQELDRQRVVQAAAERRHNEEVSAARRMDHIQQFEDSFFQLMTLFRDLRREVSIKPGGRYGDTLLDRSERHGHLAFQYAADLLEFWSRHHAYPETGTRNGLVVLYQTEVHHENEDELGPYFRVCYTLLRRVSEDRILTEKEKAKYGNLVRSQLSSAELKVISLNALTPASNDFKAYVEEFRLLKYLGTETLTRQLVEDHYDPIAFQSRD